MKALKGESVNIFIFSLFRTHMVWTYVLISVDPPSPVPCPVGGRYSFIQNFRTEQEKYRTRIRGVTEKPRVQVPCRNWVTEFKSCSNTMTRIQIDAEYCESVDYRGRPIGEYGETLVCPSKHLFPPWTNTVKLVMVVLTIPYFCNFEVGVQVSLGGWLVGLCQSF